MSALAAQISSSNNAPMDDDQEAKWMGEELARIERECEQTIAEIKADTSVESIKQQERFLLSCGIGEPAPTSWVYFIRCRTTGFYKIGVSRDPRKRLAQLQVGSPTRLSLRLTIRAVHASELEQELHSHFRASRVRGEWFMLDNGVIADLAVGNLPAAATRWLT